jgi:uncharacterized protein (TIGR00730 family)
MASTNQAVTVYCSSSSHVAAEYVEAAREMGKGIARCGWRLVYGGNSIGCMGVMADAARGAGGKVIGITPRLMVDKGIGDEKCDELVVTEGMRERKRLMEERGDAFVALPGGIGTMEEVFEILVARSLGYHKKPIVLINVEGFWGRLMEMLEHGVGEGFIRDGATKLIFVASNVGEGIEYLKREFEKAVGPPKEGRMEGVPSAIE